MMLRALPVVVLVGLAAAVASVHARSAPPAPQGMVMTASTHGFGLSGVGVTGLFPGAARAMKVTVKNPYAYAVKVPRISARVSARTTAAGCSGMPVNLVVTTPKAAAVIKAHKSKAITVRVTMPSTVANACQGARFTITLKGRAAKA